MGERHPLVVIKGAGDLATGVALRLYRANFAVVATEIKEPTAIRRTVSISRAITEGTATVEDVTGVRAVDANDALRIVSEGNIAVLADERAACLQTLKPVALVDAILAKRNLGTRLEDAPIVVALGPGFTAGVDCHAAVETMRGHDLGRVYYEGSPYPDTKEPGSIDGFTFERVMHTPKAGVFRVVREIGDTVAAGEIVAYVDGEPVMAKLNGVLRGLLPDGIYAAQGMKCGDVDPRCERRHCFTVSDKARALGGAVLEAILHFSAQ
ncbi:MAG: selenium-dependent molybdenum cofactor biosynthesis protein YqeB [Clostridiaceae bacterium]|nr:EF2563 family selenium-dependent molybdenum hydroxylase system protein [Eubacteriales bacterium]